MCKKYMCNNYLLPIFFKKTIYTQAQSEATNEGLYLFNNINSNCCRRQFRKLEHKLKLF